MGIKMSPSIFPVVCDSDVKYEEKKLIILLAIMQDHRNNENKKLNGPSAIFYYIYAKFGQIKTTHPPNPMLFFGNINKKQSLSGLDPPTHFLVFLVFFFN